MIKLNKLPKITARGKKRLGQGHGSGKGKTAGRGTKGQGARDKIGLTARMGEMSFFKRLPLMRGKYRNKPRRNKSLVVNVKYLNILPPGSIVDLETLSVYHIVNLDEAKIYGIKILGDGTLNVALNVKVPVSKKAAEKIKKAGGKVE